MLKTVSIGVFILACFGCVTTPSSDKEQDTAPPAEVNLGEPGEITDLQMETLDFPPALKQGSGIGLVKSALPTSEVAFYLADSLTMTHIFSHRPDVATPIGSVAKVFTAIAALEVLGPDYRLQTRLAIRGPVKGKTLQGDLYLIGGGNPVLNANDLLFLADSLKARGIEKVTGSFFYNESRYPKIAQIDPDRNDEAPYNAGVSALSSEFNQSMVTWGKMPNGKSLVFSTPGWPFWELGIDKRRRKIGRKEFFYRGKSNERAQWKLAGNARKHGQVRLPNKFPGKATAFFLKQMLDMVGVETKPPREKSRLPKQVVPVVSHESPQIRDLARSMLQYSNNLIAESLLLETARFLQNGEAPSSLKEAAFIVRDWYQSTFREADWRKHAVRSGSGLMPTDATTARNIVQAMALHDRVAVPASRLQSLLSPLGFKSRRARRLAHPGLGLRIFSKTGSLDFVSAIAGVLYPSGSSEPKVFAILMMDRKNRKKLDRAKGGRRARLQSAARLWKKKALKLQDQLLVTWWHALSKKKKAGGSSPRPSGT